MRLRRLPAPQLLRGEARAFGEGFKLRPHDLRVDALHAFGLRKTAVGAGDHVLAAKNFGKAHETLGDELRMLDFDGNPIESGLDYSLRRASSVY